MYPLLGPASLVGVVLLSALGLHSLTRIQRWSVRRDLNLLILMAPIVSLGISIAGLRFGTGTICFLGPLPLDYRVNIAFALVIGLGVVGGLTRGIMRLGLLHATVSRGGHAAEPRLQRLVSRLANELCIAAPRLRLHPQDHPLALTYGARRPTIVLSTWMLAHLDERELTAVIAHELAHVARRDYLVVWLATILRDAFYYLPTSRLAFQHLQQDKEPACDDMAVQLTAQPLALASALAKVWHEAARTPGLTQALAAAHTSMERRITRLLALPELVVSGTAHHRRAISLAGGGFAALLSMATINVLVLVSPMSCGAMIPLRGPVVMMLRGPADRQVSAVPESPAPSRARRRRFAVGVAGIAFVAGAIWLLSVPVWLPWQHGKPGGRTMSDAAGGYVAFALPSTASRNVPPPKLGSRMADVTLLGLNGAPVVLSEYRGKTVVLNFWATWCTPCRKEFLELVKLYQTQAHAGLVVLAVDVAEDHDQVASFAREFGATFPVAIDADSTAVARYRVAGLPTTFFVDRDGVLRAEQLGPLTADALTAKLKQTGFVPESQP